MYSALSYTELKKYLTLASSSSIIEKKINQFSFSCVKIMPFLKNKLNSKIELIYAFQLHAHCKEV